MEEAVNKIIANRRCWLRTGIAPQGLRVQYRDSANIKGICRRLIIERSTGTIVQDDLNINLKSDEERHRFLPEEFRESVNDYIFVSNLEKKKETKAIEEIAKSNLQPEEMVKQCDLEEIKDLQGVYEGEKEKVEEMERIRNEIRKFREKEGEIKRESHLLSLSNTLGLRTTQAQVENMAKECGLSVQRLRDILISLSSSSPDLVGILRRVKRGASLQMGASSGFALKNLTMMDTTVLDHLGINVAIMVSCKPSTCLCVPLLLGPQYRCDLKTFWERTVAKGLSSLVSVAAMENSDIGSDTETAHPTQRDALNMLLWMELLRIKVGDLACDTGREFYNVAVRDACLQSGRGIGFAPVGTVSRTSAVERCIKELKEAHVSAQGSRALKALWAYEPMQYIVRLGHSLNMMCRKRNYGLSPYEAERTLNGYIGTAGDGLHGFDTKQQDRGRVLDSEIRRALERLGEDESFGRRIARMEEIHQKGLHKLRFEPGADVFIVSGTRKNKRIPGVVISQEDSPPYTCVVKSKLGVLHSEIRPQDLLGRQIYSGLETLPSFIKVKKGETLEQLTSEITKREEELGKLQGGTYLRCVLCGCERYMVGLGGEKDKEKAISFLCSDSDSGCYQLCDRVASRQGFGILPRAWVERKAKKTRKWVQKSAQQKEKKMEEIEKAENPMKDIGSSDSEEIDEDDLIKEELEEEKKELGD